MAQDYFVSLKNKYKELKEDSEKLADYRQYWLRQAIQSSQTLLERWPLDEMETGRLILLGVAPTSVARYVLPAAMVSPGVSGSASAAGKLRPEQSLLLGSTITGVPTDTCSYSVLASSG